MSSSGMFTSGSRDLDSSDHRVYLADASEEYNGDCSLCGAAKRGCMLDQSIEYNESIQSRFSDDDIIGITAYLMFLSSMPRSMLRELLNLVRMKSMSSLKNQRMMGMFRAPKDSDDMTVISNIIKLSRMPGVSPIVEKYITTRHIAVLNADSYIQDAIADNFPEHVIFWVLQHFYTGEDSDTRAAEFLIDHEDIISHHVYHDRIHLQLALADIVRFVDTVDNKYVLRDEYVALQGELDAAKRVIHELETKLADSYAVVDSVVTEFVGIFDKSRQLFSSQKAGQDTEDIPEEEARVDGDTTDKHATVFEGRKVLVVGDPKRQRWYRRIVESFGGEFSFWDGYKKPSGSSSLPPTVDFLILVTPGMKHTVQYFLESEMSDHSSVDVLMVNNSGMASFSRAIMEHFILASTG